MGYDIEIVGRCTDGQLDWENSIFLGEADGEGWEELHQKVFMFTSFTEFIEQGGDRSNWDTFDNEQVKRSADKFPLLTRLHDWYADALFLENEIGSLYEEIERAQTILPNNALVTQLISAIKIATQRTACISFIAD